MMNEDKAWRVMVAWDKLDDNAKISLFAHDPRAKDEVLEAIKHPAIERQAPVMNCVASERLDDFVCEKLGSIRWWISFGCKRDHVECIDWSGDLDDQGWLDDNADRLREIVPERYREKFM